MKKYYFLLMIALVAICASCSKESDGIVDDIEDVAPKPVYKVKIVNNLYRATTIPATDGVLYDACLICSNGKLYRLGNIEDGETFEYSIQDDMPQNGKVVLIFKFGRNGQEAVKTSYYSPCTAAQLVYRNLYVDETAYFDTHKFMYFQKIDASVLLDIEGFWKNLSRNG